jgi:transposase
VARIGGCRLDWRTKVELFEEIRREYEFGVGTIKGVARKLGVHRRMVREALTNAVPPSRKKVQQRRGKITAYAERIDAILEEDRRAPRKQRHTAHRIWERLRAEVAGFDMCERSVRQCVAKRKQELGLTGREICVPQSYDWGAEAQVDWYEAWADLPGERIKLQVFAMRSMASGGAFHRAYLRATQQAFLEAHELAFEYFGGVFRRLRYDNLSSAVKKILRGSRREETARFIAFRSHWRFASEFCNPAEAHEKGGVEGEAGYFRRNHWVPVPRARDLEQLNKDLLADCYEDQQRQIAGRAMLVGAAMIVEREHLLPLAEPRFDLAEVSFPMVDSLGCVRVRTNAYSAPLKAGTQVQAKVYSTYVEIWHEGRCVARHERCYSRQQQILDLEHYLDVLEKKPGALVGSKALEQWRQAGRWPVSYDQLWAELMKRHGRPAGTRQMIELLTLGKEHGYGRLREAVDAALDSGAHDISAVRYLLTAKRTQAELPALDIGLLDRYERPMPFMNEYDRLLSMGAAQ